MSVYGSKGPALSVKRSAVLGIQAALCMKKYQNHVRFDQGH